MTTINRPTRSISAGLSTARTSERSAARVALLALILLALRVGAQPTITLQPLNRSNNVGDNAQFIVNATGSGTLSFQWQFNGANIAGGTTSNVTNNTINVLVSDASKAGNYRVLVSDSSNLTNTSSVAVLTIPYGERTKITQWNFNSTTPDNNVTTGSGSPSIGTGTLSAIGSGVGANGFNTGGTGDSAASDNSSRRWSGLSP